MKENQNVEWKESWRDEYLKWVCGFANADGGDLVIGRNDKGKVIGLSEAGKLMEDLPNKARDILGIMVKVRLREDSGKEYLEIEVDSYPYPVSYKGQYFFRSGSTNQELKGTALDRFLLSKQGRHWDGVPIPDVEVKNLSTDAIDGFRKMARASKRLEAAVLREPARGLMEKLHLFDAAHLKRASILLFHADPEVFVTGAFVKIGFFRTDTDLVYQDEVHGDLLGQVQKTQDLLLTKYLKAAISYEGIQRVETFPIPEAALREALLNAIVHKNYASGVPIQISVYPDKIMFWNSGELPADWTVKKLKEKHSSQPYNPDIANTFFRAGMIEAWGRGIERMMEACKAAGSPQPQFRYEQTGLWVQLSFPTSYEKRTEGTSAEVSVETSVKTSVKILWLLEKNPEMTLAEVARSIGKSQRAIELASSKLVKAGKLRFVGPRKGGHWEVIK